jgi:hypothetical protein
MVFDECEFEFAVETEGGGEVGFSVWVLDVSLDAKRTSSNTVRVKFKGNPANPIAAFAAPGSGISLAAGSAVSVVLASGGSVSMPKVTGVPITIEGIPVVVDIFFDHAAGSLALLGRQALVAAIEAGFNATQWLYK